MLISGAASVSYWPSCAGAGMLTGSDTGAIDSGAGAAFGVRVVLDGDAALDTGSASSTGSTLRTGSTLGRDSAFSGGSALASGAGLDAGAMPLGSAAFGAIAF